MSNLPHPHAQAPLVHPARQGASRINLQILAAAFVRAISRRPAPKPKPRPRPEQTRLEGM